jgi:putative transcriptional regulator
VGLELNRTTDVTAGDLCQTLDVDWRGDKSQIVHWGGPVQENTGWVVAGESALAGVPAATEFAADLHFAGSLEALRRAAASPPAQLRLFLGYSGWGAGQLEEELARGAWVVAPLAPEAIFEVPADALWEYAWSLLGIDPATVVSTPGVH